MTFDVRNKWQFRIIRNGIESIGTLKRLNKSCNQAHQRINPVCVSMQSLRMESRPCSKFTMLGPNKSDPYTPVQAGSGLVLTPYP